MKNNLLFSSILAITIISFAQICQAQLVIGNPLAGASTVWELLDLIFRWLFWISIPITVVMILVAAITLITSGGEKKKVETAKNTILYALLGFAVVILANGIPPLIIQIISSGQKQEKVNLPTPTDLAACHEKCDLDYPPHLYATDNDLCRSDCSKNIEPEDTCASQNGLCLLGKDCNKTILGLYDCAAGRVCCEGASPPPDPETTGCKESSCPGCGADNNLAYGNCMDKCFSRGSDMENCISNCTDNCFDYSP